jgi:hypothetical protein
MSADHDRLQSLVDALPDAIDAETAAKLDMARAEPGDDIPLEEVRRRLGL